MGICGRIASAAHPPSDLNRTLAALTIGSVRSQRHWASSVSRFASCDDGQLTSTSAGTAAVFDGRIDNRADLQRALRRDELLCCDDAQIALFCYEKWGNNFCDHIIGDFACAIWDEPQHRLLMTVDPGGVRPLFYWRDASEILFATEQRGLWSDPKVPKALDDDQMAAWLCLLPREPQRSFFRDIFRVPPGHRVICDRDRIRIERWWRPEHLPVLKLGSDRDYEDALRSSLEEAVRCRLGTEELVGSELSGGLDSSAVTATAARLLAAQGRRLTAFTAVPVRPSPSDPARFTDEWSHAAALASMYSNIDHVRIANNDTPLLDVLELREAGQDWPVQSPSNAVWGDGIHRAARDRHITIMLLGRMGNMTISYDGGELLAAQFRRANVIGAARTLHDLRRFGRRSRLGLIWDIANAVLPNAARRAFHRCVGRAETSLSDFSVINPEFLRAKGLETRARAAAGNLKNIVGDNSRMLRLAIFDLADQRGHWATGTRRLFGIDQRDPTADRRVVELCLSIPDTQFLHKGIYRSLIRRAMAGIVPDQILRERRRGRQSADWRFGFDAATPGFAGELQRLRESSLARQCLDLPKMQGLLERWPGPHDPDAASPRAYMNAFARGIVAGRYIRRIESGNR